MKKIKQIFNDELNFNQFNVELTVDFFDHGEQSGSIWFKILFDVRPFYNYSSDELEKTLEYSLNISKSIRVV